MNERICIVALAKNEEAFIHEWVVYHRILGIDHFFLYDDDARFPLMNLFGNQNTDITVIAWKGQEIHLPGRNTQTKAYTHALQNYLSEFEWVAFIDIDEFIVLPAWNDDIHQCLKEFHEVDAVSFNWHVFGHNGYYDDPPGLITSSLTRRMLAPNPNVKTITRVKKIKSISTAHFCKINGNARVDANSLKFSDDLYPGKTDRAHINHYQCRSFKRWMARVARGDVSYNPEEDRKSQQWRYDSELCLKQFVTTVAFNKNEHTDEYMLKFKQQITENLKLF